MSHGVVVWITGLPSSGKSTFAEKTRDALAGSAIPACLLDGDAVRASLVPTPGYSPAERAAFYETLARLSALVARQGFVVLVPATAHRRSFRDLARRLAPAFLEVWIDTPQAECEKRDTKGLYAATREGSAAFVPGIGETYEPPETADVIARGGRDGRALDQLTERLTSMAVSRRA